MRAALRMQQTLASFGAEAAGRGVRMRVGVNTGEVLVGALRAGGDYTAMGDVVNTASRLQTAAEPGEVLVGAGHLRRHPRRRPLRAARARSTPRAGRSRSTAWAADEPLAAARLPAPRARRAARRARRRARPAPAARSTPSVAHRRARSLLLLGEAGVGKSRLAEELGEPGRVRARARSSSRAAACPTARPTSGGRSPRRCATAAASRSSDRRRGAASWRAPTGCAAACELRADRRRGRRGSPTACSTSWATRAALRGIDPASAREEGASAVRHLRRARPPGSRPVVVVALRPALGRRPRARARSTRCSSGCHRRPLVVLATARQALEERWHAAARPPQPRGAQPRPARPPTPPPSCSSRCVGDEPSPDDWRDALLDRSGGNPFFLEELVSLLGDQPTAAEALGIAAKAVADAGLSSCPTPCGASSRRGSTASPPDERSGARGRRGARPPRRRWRPSAMMATQLGRTDDVDRVVAALDREGAALVGDGRQVVVPLRPRARGRLQHAHQGRPGPAPRRASPPGSRAARRRQPLGRLGRPLAHHYGGAAELADELGARRRSPGRPPRAGARRGSSGRRDRASEGEVLPLAERLFTPGPRPGRAASHGPPRRACLLGPGLGSRRGLGARRRPDADVRRRARPRPRLLADRHCQAWALLVLGRRRAEGGRQLRRGGRPSSEAALRFAELGDERRPGRGAPPASAWPSCSGAEFAAAERSVTDALEAFRGARRPARGEAWALQNLAWIAFVTGPAEEAEGWLQRVGRPRSPRSATRAACAGPSACSPSCGSSRVRPTRPESIGDADPRRRPERRGDRWAIGMMLVLLASVRLWTGRTDEAVEPAGEARSAVQHASATAFGLTQAGSAARPALIMAGRVEEGFAPARRRHRRRRRRRAVAPNAARRSPSLAGHQLLPCRSAT